MYYMCIYTCTYKEREGGEGESMLPLSLHTDVCIHCAYIQSELEVYTKCA